MNRVLIIEDAEDIAKLVQLHLRDLECDVDIAADGREGLKQFQSHHYDLVILDIMLPGMDGLDVCRALRAGSHYVAILMLTAKSTVMDRVLGLEMGADDYLTKPFDIEELLARVRAILRRSVLDKEGQSGFVYQSGELSIDLDNSVVSLGGKPIKLTPHEWAVLRILVKYVGQSVTTRQLLQEAWGPDYGDEGDYVRAYITRLRRKLEPDPKKPRYILLEWGVGYRMADPDTAASYQRSKVV